MTELTTTLNYDIPLDQFRRSLIEKIASDVFEATMPALCAGLFARRVIDRVVGMAALDADGVSLGEELELGLTGNVVAEMGISLYRLAKLLDRSEFSDLPQLAKRIGWSQRQRHL